MPLTHQQITPGAIAYFDPAILNADERVGTPASPTTRPGPFVCFQREGTISAWTAITTSERPERLRLSAEWRSRGTRAWRENDQFVNDGSTTYVGENEAFIQAAADTDQMNANGRGRLAEDGVQAVLEYVISRAGSHL